MKCFYCGGKMKSDRTTYTINKKGYHLLIHGVPAWVCTQCGEVYFEGDTIKTPYRRSLTALIKKLERSEKKVLLHR